MLIKTQATIEEIRDKIFKNNMFGNPKYAAVVNETSWFYVYEEYTFRNANYMSISVMLEDKEDYRLIHYIVSGAARGLLGVTWGATQSRENRIIKQFQHHNIVYELIQEQ